MGAPHGANRSIAFVFGRLSERCSSGAHLARCLARPAALSADASLSVLRLRPVKWHVAYVTRCTPSKGACSARLLLQKHY